jgi:hypothetical protein
MKRDKTRSKSHQSKKFFPQNFFSSLIELLFLTAEEEEEEEEEEEDKDHEREEDKEEEK